jgi:hypothetical protein
VSPDIPVLVVWQMRICRARTLTALFIKAKEVHLKENDWGHLTILSFDLADYSFTSFFSAKAFSLT